jgi:transposase-like protein
VATPGRHREVSIRQRPAQRCDIESGWGALREVFPQAREQRCWFRKIANVLSALPKSAHHGGEKALAEICNAEDHRQALEAVKSFEAAYGTKSRQSRREDRRRPGGTSPVLRLSRRALDSPAHTNHIESTSRPYDTGRRSRGVPARERGPSDGVQTALMH